MDEKKNRTYTDEFKVEALALLKSSEKSAQQLERELGITPGLLLKWQDRYQVIAQGPNETSLQPSDLEAAQRKVEALGTGTAGGSRGARDPKKSSQHFLPEKRMKYTFIAATTRASFRSSACAGCWACRAAGIMPGSSGRPVRRRTGQRGPAGADSGRT